MFRKDMIFASKKIVYYMKKTTILLVLLCQNTLFAQNQKEEIEQLEELIIEENRMQIPFQNVTRNIQVVTKEDIKKMPVTSINELLAYVGGVDIRQRGPFGMQADISIDGGSFEQTMILWNGVKMGDAQTAHHSMNLPIPLVAIERIEILKGPAARIYGINALTGAVNIVTKTQSKDFLQLDLSTGSSFKEKEEGDGKGKYAGVGAQITTAFATGNVNNLASFSINDYNGQRYNTASQSIKALYQGNVKWSESNQLQWLSGYTKNDFGANGYYAAPHDKESFEMVQTLLTSVGSIHKVNEHLTIKPRISNRYNEDDYRFYRNDLSKARSLHYSNALMFELNSIYESSIGDFGLGYELRLEEINSSNLGAHDRNNHGWFAEYKNSFADRWNVNVGAYWNYNSDYGFQWYPGADVAYLIDDSWKASFSIGSSQRIPSFTDLYVNQRPGNIGNPDLQPETAWQYEVGLNYNKKSSQFLIHYFDRSISDFIDWTRVSTDVPYQPFNVGQQRMRGIFTKWKQDVVLDVNHRFGYQISYQYLSPKENEENEGVLSKYVIESLKHQLIFGVNYSYQNFSIQWQNRWIKRELNEAYFVSDVKASYQKNAFEVYAQATNLFDAEYKEIAAVPMPSRWLTVGVKYNLFFKKASL